MTVTCQKIETRAGRIVVTWGDGSTTEFLNRAEIEGRLARDARRDRQVMENLLLHKIAAAVRDGLPVRDVEGLSVTLNRDAAEPVRIATTALVEGGRI